MSDVSYFDALINILETLQMKDIIEKIVSKLLATCMKLSKSGDASVFGKTGTLTTGYFM